MLLPTSWIRWGLFLIAVLPQVSVAAAELPSADEILAIHCANQQKLSQLHLQLVLTDESTAAAGRAAGKEADEKENLFRLVSQNPDDARVEFDGKLLEGEEALQLLRQIAPAPDSREMKSLRSMNKPFRMVRPMEFFLNGDDYQFRGPVQAPETDEEIQAWTFTNAPLTADTLLTDYREISIFSRSGKSVPSGRWWHRSADRHAYVMEKDLTDVMSMRLPPYTNVTHPQWDRRHPIDAFFSQSADRYQVLRQEESDGRVLTVVDVAVPISKDSSTQLFYRAWLDLNRGAVPAKIHHRQVISETPFNHTDLWTPHHILTTHDIRELTNGAFYPAKTVSEEYGADADAPALTEAQLVEVRAGKLKVPGVVHRRYTWDCSTVEVKTDYSSDFFIIPFPANQTLFDHDAGKMVGALETQPLVQVGQLAPPLTIAHWIHGNPRTLASLKGQVVVLDFWGLWCGSCRGSVPKLNELREQFHGKPVTFIAIHNAEKDPIELAGRISAFAKSSDWQFIHAIDAGRMIEDSLTTAAYGVKSFPFMVIVGVDGNIAYVEPYMDGPFCDEEDPALLAEFEKKVNALYQSRFESVGETWPITETADENQKTAILQRVEKQYLIQQIEKLLNQAASFR